MTKNEEYDRVNNEICPFKWCRNQKRYDKVFGECAHLLFQVLVQQSGMEIPTVQFYNYCVQMTTDVMAYQEPCNLDTAYKTLGYDGVVIKNKSKTDIF
tara:strand:+ start:9489 stop:9782 length:294 start_codon:yes stop_codon:yes gene_type:complete